jgi:hypothetical protein
VLLGFAAGTDMSAPASTDPAPAAPTQHLQLGHGHSPLSAGVRALPVAAAVTVMAPLSSRLVARLGIRMVVPVDLALMGGGLLLFTRPRRPRATISQLAYGRTD